MVIVTVVGIIKMITSSGKDPDWSRSESNDRGNPSTGEVQNNGGCYLTSACMRYFKENFDDNCYELRVLRWFRDNFVSKADTEHYYQTAPYIVSAIDEEENQNLVYNYIYDNVVDYCIKAIENADYTSAYIRYRDSILNLEETFVKKPLQNSLIKALKKITLSN